MLRRLFTLLSALSLLLCAAVVVLWVRSHMSVDEMALSHDGRTFVMSHDGAAIIRFLPPEPVTGNATAIHGWQFLGFASYRMYHGQSSHYSFQVPYWPLTLLTSVLPAWSLVTVVRRNRRGRRNSAGLCPTCGYDLRATPGRCPECGTVASKEE